MTLIDSTGVKRRLLFVTGCFRSGTTLTEKLLHNHPNACVTSQPFPQLYYWVKEQFLESCGCERRYALDHEFRQTGYSRDQWLEFVRSHRLTADDLIQIFDRLRESTGAVWTPQVHALRGKVEPGVFHDVYRQLVDQLAEVLVPNGASMAGSKEVMCEEFVPAMLAYDTAVAMTVRDPRDMIASLNFQERGQPMGKNRPLLFSLRVWRKSVAYVLAMEGNSAFYWVKYEDLVTRWKRQLDRFTQQFRLPPFEPDAFREGICDQAGQRWSGNSSFADYEGVVGESSGAFAKRLPGDVLAYIETVCGPEMAALGYSAEQPRLDRRQLESFCEPFDVSHRLFTPNYSSSPDHVDEELRRLDLLETASPEMDEAQKVEWFLFGHAYERLRDALRKRTRS